MPVILSCIFQKNKQAVDVNMAAKKDEEAVRFIEKIVEFEMKKVRWQREKEELKEQLEQLKGHCKEKECVKLQKGFDEEKKKFGEWSRNLLSRLAESEQNLKFEVQKRAKLMADNERVRLERDELRGQLEDVKEQYRVLQVRGAAQRLAPECPVCMMEYTQAKERVPRVLVCGHSLCQRCALKLAGDTIIKCPFCRKKTILQSKEVQKLPKNFALIEVLENFH